MVVTTKHDGGAGEVGVGPVGLALELVERALAHGRGHRGDRVGDRHALRALPFDRRTELAELALVVSPPELIERLPQRDAAQRGGRQLGAQQLEHVAVAHRQGELDRLVDALIGGQPDGDELHEVVGGPPELAAAAVDARAHVAEHDPCRGRGDRGRQHHPHRAGRQRADAHHRAGRARHDEQRRPPRPPPCAQRHRRASGRRTACHRRASRSTQRATGAARPASGRAAGMGAAAQAAPSTGYSSARTSASDRRRGRAPRATATTAAAVSRATTAAVGSGLMTHSWTARWRPCRAEWVLRRCR